MIFQTNVLLIYTLYMYRRFSIGHKNLVGYCNRRREDKAKKRKKNGYGGRRLGPISLESHVVSAIILMQFPLILTVMVARAAGHYMFDETELLQSSRKPVKYHLYDPQLFLMYTDCLPLLHRPCFDSPFFLMKYATDVVFLESLIALNRSVPPHEAELFVIPVYYNQADVPAGSCFPQRDHMIAQMYSTLEQQGHYKRGFRNHLLMASHYSAGLPEPFRSGQRFHFRKELIVGRYEQPAYSVRSSDVLARSAYNFFNR